MKYKPRVLNQSEISRIIAETNVNSKKDMIHQVMSDEYQKPENIRAYVTVATGVGKTYWASSIIQKINKKNPHFSIGIVVPSKNLKDAFQKYIDRLSLQNVEVYVINSYTMSNKINREHDVLIIDELQHAAGKSKFFSKVIPISSAKAVLGLTATLKKSHHEFLQALGLKHIFDLNIDEARLLGVTPDFEKYNIPIQLTTEEKALYAKHQTEYEKYVDYFTQVDPNNPAGFLFTLKGNKYQRNNANLNFAARKLELSEGQVIGVVRKWFDALQGRNKILQQATNGKKMVIELCKRLNGKTINFVNDIQYAEYINSQLENSVVYHSELTAKQAKTALKKFESDAQYINTVKALDEGYDLPAITYGINQGYDSSEIKSAQRIGRCVRYDENFPDKIAKVFFLYVDDFNFLGKKYKSQQLVWLRSSQFGMKGVQWVNNIDECFN